MSNPWNILERCPMTVYVRLSRQNFIGLIARSLNHSPCMAIWRRDNLGGPFYQLYWVCFNVFHPFSSHLSGRAWAQPSPEVNHALPTPKINSLPTPTHSQHQTLTHFQHKKQVSASRASRFTVSPLVVRRHFWNPIINKHYRENDQHWETLQGDSTL